VESHDRFGLRGNGKIEIDHRSGMHSESRTRYYGSGAEGLLRRSVPKSRYSRQKRVVGMLAIIACAAALVAVSSIALAPSGKVTPKVPGETQAPGPIYYVFGTTRDIAGLPLPFCNVNLTDKTTGKYNNAIVSNDTGFYRFDVNNGLAGGVSVGDIMNITATKGALTGYNQTTLPPALLKMDVTLSGVVIPEFGGMMIPLAGILSIFAIARVASNRNKT
jgi:hypothetical protein